MPKKVRILEQIGAKSLLLPELINRALAANDRVKYYVELLQMAAAHAQAPNQRTNNLHDERVASGVDAANFDQIVEESRALSPDLFLIPSASKVFELLVSDLHQMLEPLHVAATSDPELRKRVEVYMHRLAEGIARTSRCDDDHVSTRVLEALARRGTVSHDSVHQLITDLHWELNHLQAGVAVESIDGARVHGLSDGDRVLVRAFMKGVNETAPLKFDHEGLGTTASRDDERLSIQNDLGTGDAHVVVLYVSDLTATVVYTDAHPPRAAFLRQMLEPHDVKWDSAAGDAGGGYEMHVGRFTATNRDDLERYLTFFGSRLVFLVDWNRARKRLARFVKMADAVMLLKWAADNNVGHRAFLQAGDVRLIHTAIERAAPRQMRIGARLDELLGREPACAFLMTVLAIASDGLTNHRSMGLIEDEIEAELLTYLQTTDQVVLTAVADHANLVSALSDRLRDALVRLRGHGIVEDAARTADLAKAWEHRAAEIVRRSIRLLAQTNDGHDLRRLLLEANAAADVLEQAAFTLTLVPPQSDHKGVALLDDLANLVNQSAREYVRCIEDARDIRRAPTRPDLERFLVAVDRLADLQRQCDTAERVIEATLLHGSGDFRELHVLSTMARAFRQAVESLARCSVIVHDYVLASTASGR